MANRAKCANIANNHKQKRENKDRKQFNKDMRDWYVKIARKRKEMLANPVPISDDGVKTEENYKEVYQSIVDEVMG